MLKLKVGKAHKIYVRRFQRLPGELCESKVLKFVRRSQEVLSKGRVISSQITVNSVESSQVLCLKHAISNLDMFMLLRRQDVLSCSANPHIFFFDIFMSQLSISSMRFENASDPLVY